MRKVRGCGGAGGGFAISVDGEADGDDVVEAKTSISGRGSWTEERSSSLGTGTASSCVSAGGGGGINGGVIIASWNEGGG